MNSKECLENLFDNQSYCSECDYYHECNHNKPLCKEWYNTIKQDLDRLETFDYIAEQNVELREENAKLKQALDKACERLEWTCPVDQELVEDLDCDNCNDNCKECWKKYFMKEVL